MCKILVASAAHVLMLWAEDTTTAVRNVSKYTPSSCRSFHTVRNRNCHSLMELLYRFGELVISGCGSYNVGVMSVSCIFIQQHPSVAVPLGMLWYPQPALAVFTFHV